MLIIALVTESDKKLTIIYSFELCLHTKYQITVLVT